MVKDDASIVAPATTARRRRSGPLRAAALTAALAVALGACSGDPDADSGPRTLTVWRHSGTPAEEAVVTAQVADFNAAQDDIEVELRSISEGDYNDQLQAAIASRSLPDVFEVDGPLIPSYAYQDALAPLDDLLPEATLAGQLPSLQAQGTLDGERLAVGVFDSGLGLYADRRQLRAAGITDWPTTADEAWTAGEFERVLQRLAARDRDGRVLDVKLNYGVGEWLSYGFSPLVASAGGELIDPATLEPRGHLDGAPAQRALVQLASWAPYVDPNQEDDAFTSRRVALSWVGHWVYRDYAEALGEDLLLLPLPDLGLGSKTGQGSWAWGIARTSERQADAAAFLDFLLEPDQVLRVTDDNGAVPGIEEALARSELYGDGGPLRLFAEQLLASCGNEPPTTECVAVPRPSTPGYAVLSARFATAVSAALNGEDPRQALREAAEMASADLEANGGFGE